MVKSNDKLVKREKKLGFNWFFWISLIAILIPVGYFGRLLYLASQESNVPINGDRIQDTVIYEISQQQVEEVQQVIATVEGVESCSTTLAVQTLRITINAQDSLDADGLKALLETVYEKVIEKLPEETYFTRVENVKEYDLEITAYDNLSNESPVIVSLTKNAAYEEGKQIQVISSPINQDVTDKVLQNAADLEAAENGENQSSDFSYQLQPEGTADATIGDE